MKLPSSLSLSPKVITDILFRKNERVQLFLELSEEKRVQAFRSVTARVKQDIATGINDKQLAGLLEQLDPDEATDVLQMLDQKKRRKVLDLLSQNLKEALSVLLEFDAQSAAGLMTLDYIRVDAHDYVELCAERFKKHEQKTGRPPVILVTHDAQLTGYVPGYELAFADKKQKIGSVVQPVPSISYTASHDEVVRLFHKNPHSRVVVLNDAGSVMGIIYSDDVLQLMKEKEAASLYDFAGINQSETVTDSVAVKVQHRYRWLILNLATAFLAAYTISLFEDTLSQFVLLAVYMPIVAGMGGNAATQTLAVLVRGIALHQIELKTGLKTLKNEVLAGLSNGLINGVLVAVIVYGINQNLRLSLVLGSAMIVNLVVAGFFGTLIPLVLARLGKDPAASATVLITTATDVLGFVAFLGLGALVLT